MNPRSRRLSPLTAITAAKGAKGGTYDVVFGASVGNSRTLRFTIKAGAAVQR
jgi:hypothetical protein